MEQTQTEKKLGAFEKRIHEIDFARGMLMVLVIMDHLFYLLRSYNGTWFSATGIQFFGDLHGFFDFYWTWQLRKIVQYIALGGFCFLSGISSAFSRNNWTRAWQMVGMWAFVFIGSNLLDYWYKSSGVNLGLVDVRVDFNVIGVLAFSTLIYCFFQKKPWWTLLVVAGIGFAIHVALQIIWMIDPSWGEDIYCPILWKPSNLVAPQADHMPLVPYISFFFLGALLTKFTYMKEKKSYFKRYEFERPICFLGRHSLIVYITHYGILIALFALVDLIFF